MVDNTDRKSAFLEELFRIRYLPMLHYAISSMRNPELAEEAVQETFRIAWTKIDNLATSPNPNGWLLVTLKHVLSNMRRTKSALFRLEKECAVHCLPSKPSAHSELDPEIYLSGILSSESWEILKLSIEGYTCNEIAQRCGKTPEACKKQLQRSKQKLLQHLEK